MLTLQYLLFSSQTKCTAPPFTSLQQYEHEINKQASDQLDFGAGIYKKSWQSG